MRSPAPNPPGDHLIAFSVSELCSAVGICRQTLYSAWQCGRGPKKLKIGKRTLVTREALTAWLVSLETPSNGSDK